MTSSESEDVKVPFKGSTQDQATLLLAAAEELDLDASVVKVTTGAFLVPKEVAEHVSDDKPAKKTAAKKTPTKNTQE